MTLLIPSNKRYKELFDYAKQVASTELSLFLYGETGTGKDILAHFIHAESQKEGPLVIVDCNTLQDNLLESELFGHTKGAFTDAVTEKKGKIEEAHNGTLFLDEVGHLPLKIQQKLLRVIETKSISRVGENNVRRINFRLITAMNEQLDEALQKGLIRSDFFYRINQVQCNLPSLSEHPDVILEYIHFFTEQFNKQHNSHTSLPPSCIDDFLSKNWPGNIRELKHAVFRELVTNPDSHSDISDKKRSLPELLDQVEIAYITKALKEQNGSISHAATSLGLSRQALHQKIKRHQISTHKKDSQLHTPSEKSDWFSFKKSKQFPETVPKSFIKQYLNIKDLSDKKQYTQVINETRTMLHSLSIDFLLTDSPVSTSLLREHIQKHSPTQLSDATQWQLAHLALVVATSINNSSAKTWHQFVASLLLYFQNNGHDNGILISVYWGLAVLNNYSSGYANDQFSEKMASKPSQPKALSFVEETLTTLSYYWTFPKKWDSNSFFTLSTLAWDTENYYLFAATRLQYLNYLFLNGKPIRYILEHLEYLKHTLSQKGVHHLKNLVTYYSLVYSECSGQTAILVDLRQIIDEINFLFSPWHSTELLVILQLHYFTKQQFSRALLIRDSLSNRYHYLLNHSLIEHVNHMEIELYDWGHISSPNNIKKQSRETLSQSTPT